MPVIDFLSRAARALTVAAFLTVSFAGPVSAQTINSKLVVPADADVPLPAGIKLLADYGSYRLFSLDSVSAAQLAGQFGGQGVQLLQQPDLLQFEAQTFDTIRNGLTAPSGFGFSNPSGASLHLVQFVGPVKQEWLDSVIALGAQPVHYVASNGYLVWADAQARQRLNQLIAQDQFLQFSEVYHGFFKVDRTLTERLRRGDDPSTVVPVVVQIHSLKEGNDSKGRIEALSAGVRAGWESILSFENGRFDMPLSAIQEIAELPDVYRIEEILPRERFDEVQNQIIAGEFNRGMTGPSGPGYLAVLSSYGFPTTPSSYPIVDVVDDGIGTGSVNSGDPTLHDAGLIGNATRLGFVSNCTNSANGAGVDGHGHINVSIVGGFDAGSGFPFQDPNGFLRGQGVNPYGRIAGTRIFDPGFDLSSCGGTDTGLIAHTQNQGAQISTNSWGCGGCAGSYDSSSQAYDVGVRDSDLAQAGNQEMMHLFAAGNDGSGSGTIGSPGNGKNMLTVGASENQRPSDEDGNWTDGCGTGPTGANNAMDVIGFSSRGPAPGGRVKPETIAPGTHIQGTASTNGGYTGNSVCDQYRPSGQTTYASSSGTSHSTPAVAGLTSLVWWWLENAASVSEINGTLTSIVGTPSPALLKAYILAHPTYLTGVSANDTLPSNNQGYGMPNMSLLFNNVPKGVVNQTVTFDNSGENWQFLGTVADTNEPVRVMLVYTDAAGATGTSPQVNDLNLTVTVGGNTYNGNVFSGQWSTTGGSADALNNYEGVFLPPGTSGAITVNVSAFNIAGNGVPNSGDGTDQDFALVCSNCAADPTFSLDVTPPSVGICAGNNAQYMVDVGSILGFSDPVTLSVSGEPAGTSTDFSTNPVNPPGNSTLTISNTGGATAGNYLLTVQGVGGGDMQMTDVMLDLATGVPTGPTLTSPVDAAMGVGLVPTLMWSSVTGASDYLVEVATDPAFASIVYSATEASTSHSPMGLVSDTTYYWRVTAQSACGNGQSTAFSFTTINPPGSCPVGMVSRTYLFDDMESGAPGWTHGGTQDTWTLSSASANSGTMSYHATNVASVSDQLLVSPPATLPAGLTDYRLRFFNEQIIEDQSASACYDGAVLEISTNGGANWTRITSADLITDPYKGPINGSFGNPLSGDDAWCGDPQAWLDSEVDLDAYAGQTVQFRFRLATDMSVGREGWYIDDVRVQACEMSGANNPPIAVNDSYTVDEDMMLIADDADGSMNGDANDNGVLANDSDPDMDPLVVSNAGTFAAGGIGGTVMLSADGTFTYTPPADTSGMATFTYMADDGAAQSMATATIDVMPMEDPPQLMLPGPQMTLEDTGFLLPPITVSDVDTTALTITLDAFSGTMTLVTTAGLVVNGDGSQSIMATGSVADLNAALNGVAYSPLPNVFGTDQIGLTLDDGVNRGGVDVTGGIDIDITPVNDAPSFASGGNVLVLEDNGAHSMAWATAISAGPNEGGQSLSFNASVTGTTGSLSFASAPAVNSAGVLSFTATSDTSGTATVDVSLMDNGGTANGGVDSFGPASFTITVTGVNDAPSFSPGGNVNVLEDSGAYSNPWASAISAGPADESGQSVSFDVSVTATTGNVAFDAAPALDSGGNLTFTVTADTSGTASIDVFAMDDGGTANGGDDTSPSESFMITIIEVNDPPSFAPGGNVIVLEDSGAYSMAWASGIDAGPASESGQTVSFDVTVTGTTGGLTFSAAPAVDSAGVLSFTSDTDSNGTATLEVFAMDDGGTANGGDDTSATETFTITVGAVNDPPEFTPGGDVPVLEDSGAYSMAWASAIGAGAADESGQNVTFDVNVTGTTGGLVLIAAPAIDAAGVLSFESQTDSSGTATVKVFAMDDGGTADGGDDTSATETVTITVTEINDEPSFTPGGDVPVLEDSGAYSMAWASAISAGPADESGQTVSFDVSVTGTTGGLTFASAPAVDGSGVLTFEPQADSSGTATVEVFAMDDGGTANGGDDTSATETFTITVTEVNDEPGFTPGGNVNVSEDSGAYSMVWASAVSAGPAGESGQSVSFDVSVTGTTGGLTFSAAPAVDAAGVLSFTPDTDSNGTATVEVFAMDDGGTANGGDDTSATDTFTITVAAVNDAPEFTPGGDVPVLEDSGAYSMAWASAIGAGAADESGQTVSFDVSVTGTTGGLSFAGAPTVDGGGVLSFEPLADSNGTASVEVFAMDDGGTANGGDDTSATETFTITVNPVNDEPSFTPGGDIMVLEDSGLYGAAWASALSAGPVNESGQSLSFNITGNTNPGLFATAPTVDNAGVLSFEPAIDANGSSDVSLALMDDGGIADGGDDTSGSETFTVNVTTAGDLAIDKSSGTFWTPGGGFFVYTIEVSNLGPSDVANATVTDTPPARLGNLQWDCTASSGASCTASGAGPINEQVSVDEGAMVTFTLMADLLDMDETPVTNTASVSAPVETPDPDSTNNSDSDTDLIGVFADSFESVER